MTRAADHTRTLALGALLLGVGAVIILLATTGASYSLNARFLNAGGLVSGGSVEIAGRTVGSISSITLTPNGLANVRLSVDDGAVTPLHEGTHASIRAVGQAAITSNFVVLTPGPSNAPALPNGAVLSTAQTTGIVPIDALLNSFGPAQRSNLDALIASGAQLYAGSGGHQFNTMLAKLDPALGALEGFSGQLALDRGAIAELIQTGSTDANALASRGSELTSAVVNSAHALGAIASQRTALADVLSRMPAVLSQARGTLARTGAALTALRPALRDVPPAAAPLRDLLGRIDAMLPVTAPVLDHLRIQLPALNRSLVGLKPLSAPAVSALHSL
ncbi:MAG: MlaD family protein, partial [Solirubrobacteraceae bacterium]